MNLALPKSHEDFPFAKMGTPSSHRLDHNPNLLRGWVTLGSPGPQFWARENSQVLRFRVFVGGGFFLKNLQDWKKLGRKKSHGRWLFFCCIMFTGFWFFTLRIRKPLNPVPSFWKPKHPCYTSSFTLPLEDPGILRARNLEEMCSRVSYLVHIQVSFHHLL